MSECITEDDACFLPDGRMCYSIKDGRVLRELDARVRPQRDWMSVDEVHLCDSVGEFVDLLATTLEGRERGR